MPVNGVRYTGSVLFTVARACKDAGRLDLARVYLEEFEANGVRVRPGLKALLGEAASQREGGLQAAASS